MSKIDPFSALGTDVPEEPTEAVPEVLEYRPSEAQRNRDWEKKRRRAGRVATYRGIPQHLQAEIKRVAEDRHVPIGEVARAFLEHGLAAYGRGELTLEPAFGPGKLTLYPGD